MDLGHKGLQKATGSDIDWKYSFSLDSALFDHPMDGAAVEKTVPLPSSSSHLNGSVKSNEELQKEGKVTPTIALQFATPTF